MRPPPGVIRRTVLDDPMPNCVLDQAIGAELARFGDGPTPVVREETHDPVVM
jgi:hypothetical protein